MELSFTTLVLEIVNFLVLVWILKRFLYRPVLDLVDRRRAMIEKTMADAEAKRREAEALEARYEGRLAEWDREKREARESLAAELEAEKGRRREALEADLEAERERRRQAAARQQADEARRLERAALRNGAEFASGLLRGAAGPELETRLVDLFIGDLEQLTPERREALRGEGAPDIARVTAWSAYPLDEERRRRLREAVATLVGEGPELAFERDASLLAGLRVAVGDRELALNLRDELRGFAEFSGTATAEAPGEQPA